MNKTTRRRTSSVQNPLETYLREINETSLLNAKQEKDLARRIAVGDMAARDQMVRANLRLVVNIAAPEARFSANFARLGFHHGFGLSVTLPAAVGGQRAAELLYTGRRITGDDAGAIGLVDRVVPLDELTLDAHDFAAEIAGSAPLAVQSIRATLRGDLADRIAAATDHELLEQERLRRTADFREGTSAMSERRPPQFTGVE